MPEILHEVVVGTAPIRLTSAEVNELWHDTYRVLMGEWTQALETVPSCMAGQVRRIAILNRVLDRLRLLVNILPTDAPVPPHPRDLWGPTFEAILRPQEELPELNEGELDAAEEFYNDMIDETARGMNVHRNVVLLQWARGLARRMAASRRIPPNEEGQP